MGGGYQTDFMRDLRDQKIRPFRYPYLTGLIPNFIFTFGLISVIPFKQRT